MINAKPKGKCPFCSEQMIPIILEENILRRDRCQCAICSNTIYICRMPSCNNYAKGGDYYDDELCPDCQESFSADNVPDSSDNNTSNQSLSTTKGTKDGKLSQPTTKDMAKDKGNKLDQKAEASKSFDNDGAVASTSGSSGSDESGILDVLSDITRIFSD